MTKKKKDQNSLIFTIMNNHSHRQHKRISIMAELQSTYIQNNILDVNRSIHLEHQASLRSKAVLRLGPFCAFSKLAM